jgi:hypothetical protein
VRAVPGLAHDPPLCDPNATAVPLAGRQGLLNGRVARLDPAPNADDAVAFPSCGVVCVGCIFLLFFSVAAAFVLR